MGSTADHPHPGRREQGGDGRCSGGGGTRVSWLPKSHRLGQDSSASRGRRSPSRSRSSPIGPGPAGLAPVGRPARGAGCAGSLGRPRCPAPAGTGTGPGSPAGSDRSPEWNWPRVSPAMAAGQSGARTKRGVAAIRINPATRSGARRATARATSPPEGPAEPDRARRRQRQTGVGPGVEVQRAVREGAGPVTGELDGRMGQPSVKGAGKPVQTAAFIPQPWSRTSVRTAVPFTPATSGGLRPGQAGRQTLEQGVHVGLAMGRRQGHPQPGGALRDRRRADGRDQDARRLQGLAPGQGAPVVAHQQRLDRASRRAKGVGPAALRPDGTVQSGLAGAPGARAPPGSSGGWRGWPAQPQAARPSCRCSFGRAGSGSR